MITVRSLGSGSSGNALLIDDGDSVVAVDCGIGPRAMGHGLRAAGRRLAELDAVLLTHEHTDHVRALPQIVANKVLVAATPGTARAAMLPMAGWRPMQPRKPVQIGTMEATALAVSHDAAEPCGYHLRTRAGSITILTDLGVAHESLHDYLAASDLIVLEANHDEELLRRGPYPAYLKRRVLSATGHLSNTDSGALLVAALRAKERPRTVWLAHLSTTNNRPELARSTVQAALSAHGCQADVVPMPRHGHELVWQSAQPVTMPAQLGLDLVVPR